MEHEFLDENQQKSVEDDPHFLESSDEEDEDENCNLSIGSNVESGSIRVDKELKPIMGMTFPTYEEARDFYNCYAKQLGFGTRIKASYTNPKTKMKQYGWFSCSKEGFKDEKSEVIYRRANLRTGCNAHMKVKLLKSNTWEVVSLELDHNHGCSPSKSHRFRSHKHMESGSKKRLELNCDAGIRLNKSFHSIVVNAGGHNNVPFGSKEARNYVDKYKRLKLKEGDAEAMHKYFTRMQLKNPNFFYVVELDDEGHLRNVFWADGRSRAAYSCFGDVITFDTTYLTNRYDLKFAPFVGVNHHGQSVLFGCGLLADETSKSFEWLFNAWLNAMSVCPPNAIITDQSKAMEKAIKRVFPNARHRWCLWHIMNKIADKLGSYKEYIAIKKAMKNAVYESLRIEEFEESWKKMIEGYSLEENKWLSKLYDSRHKWVPVFLKDVFFAGMSTTQRSESMNVFFDGYVHSRTSLKEFVDQYELALKDKFEKETQADFVSFNTTPHLKTSCIFEGQIAKVYTKNMFEKFQAEVFAMGACSRSQMGGVGEKTYAIKERVIDKKGIMHSKVYEVIFDEAKTEIFCICRLFEHKGILCRHALYVLNEFVDEIPSRYILPRWRKDFKRVYVETRASHNVIVDNPVQRHDILFPYALQILEEGVVSESKFRLALDGFRDLSKKMFTTITESCENNDQSAHIEANELSEAVPSNSVKLLNPLQAKRVGRQKNSRIKSPSEISLNKKIRKQKKILTKVHREVLSIETNIVVPTDDINNDREVNTLSSSVGFQESINAKDDIFVGSTNGFFTNLLGSQSASTDNMFGRSPNGYFTELLGLSNTHEDVAYDGSTSTSGINLT